MALVEKLAITMDDEPSYRAPKVGDIIELSHGEDKPKVYAALFGSEKGLVADPIVSKNGTSRTLPLPQPTPLENITADIKVVGRSSDELYTEGTINAATHYALIGAWFSAQEKKGE